MKICLIFLAFVALSQGSKIGPKLTSDLYSSKAAFNIALTFSSGTSDIVKEVHGQKFPNREGRLTTLKSRLEANALRSQANVVAYLQKNGVEFKSSWISNQIFVRGANKEIIQTLGNEFQKEIAEIEVEEQMKIGIDRKQPRKFVNRQRPTEWGIQKILGEEANALLQNVTAGVLNPVRVATIGTGVRYTHVALRGNYLGTYGWFDPFYGTQLPSDEIGQDTHATGIIAGGEGIGVFPSASWMACKGCDGIFCNQAEILACAEFMTCPTLPGGQMPNCSYAPNVISCIWGGGQGNTWFNSVINAWREAGIVPFFAVGTDPSGGHDCSSVASPGDQPGVISSGALVRDDTLFRFATHGPSVDGLMKPEFAAPGDDIVSAFITDDTAYWSYSGSGMANSHTAGVAALLLAYDDTLTPTEVFDFLVAGVETKELVGIGTTCGDDQGDGEFPNNSFGHGRINAMNSLMALIIQNPK